MFRSEDYLRSEIEKVEQGVPLSTDIDAFSNEINSFLKKIRFCLTGAWESIGAAFPAAVSVDAGAGAVGLETDAFFSSAFAGGAAFGTFTSRI